MVLAEFSYHSSKNRGWAEPGSGFEKTYTAEFWRHPPPKSLARSNFSSTTIACRSSGARGLTVSPTSARRSESRGASWSRSSTLHPSSRFSTLLCRRRWTQWLEVLKIFDKSLPDVEQVIEVPKIIQHMVPPRSSLQEPQMAEQLVEVPGFEFVFVRRAEGALCLGVVRVVGHTWSMRVCDTGWRDTASPERYTHTGHRWRLRDHARQVPAVADQQWMVPLSSSSTEWWILPLCYRDRYAQCQTVLFFGLVIDMPAVVHVKVVDITVVAQRPFPMVQFSRPLRFPSCVPLTRCSMSLLFRSSKFLGCSRCGDSRDPTVAAVEAGHCRSHARRCATTADVWFRRQKTFKVPQLQYF